MLEASAFLSPRHSLGNVIHSEKMKDLTRRDLNRSTVAASLTLAARHMQIRRLSELMHVLTSGGTVWQSRAYRSEPMEND